MDGKKEEALKCLKIAREAIECCDRVRAQQFITKAQKLDPSLSSADILSRLNGHTVESSTKPSHAKPRTPDPDRRQGRVSEPGSSSTTSSAYTEEHTEEHIAIVREINNKKNYYEILDVEESCTVEDIRKAYRKLSLKVHPDKNKAPDADVAFTAVSKAFKCLSDEESRERYKLTGYNEQAFERGAAGPGRDDFFGGNAEAEEMFRNFFCGGIDPAVFFPELRGPGNRNQPPIGPWKKFIQVLPFLLLFVWKNMPSNYPIYKVWPRDSYQLKFTTQKGTDFYVKSKSFEQAYPPNSPQRVKLEMEVEKDYVEACRHGCMLELQFPKGIFKGYCDLLKEYKARA
ncbi:hypothetical protein Vadar_026415 [Vaccinium darrowii]|uniref:Uncharacterized protein n=1 Tax=Vaccinium darrowii TaxID=229202 RepID=A0ACB7Y1W3_9ERIC|nr:hypothetical protein Vadar_026415 [Vaccinium darrowii]